MKCCLWLNGVKVWSARDIKNNFDPASLRGYFFGGSLLRWLKANDGIEEAKKLEETGDIEYSFGVVGRDALGTPTINIPIAANGTSTTIAANGASRAPRPTSGSYNQGSGSGSGGLGYGLHII
jgi:hypothetical protein